MKHIYTLEFWKDIEGYEGLYQVSNTGQIKSLKINRIRKPRPNNNGYLLIDLHKNGEKKTYQVHRLVAEAFLSNEEELPEIDHINNDRQDNRVCNLQWISHVENLRKRQAGIAIPRKVQCLETGEIFESSAAAAKSVDRHETTMGKHLRGLTQICAGKHFKYYE